MSAGGTATRLSDDGWRRYGRLRLVDRVADYVVERDADRSVQLARLDPGEGRGGRPGRHLRRDGRRQRARDHCAVEAGSPTSATPPTHPPG